MSYPDPTVSDLAAEYYRMADYLAKAETELAYAEQELALAREQVSLKASKVAKNVENERGAWKKLVKARAEANPEKAESLDFLLASPPEKE